MNSTFILCHQSDDKHEKDFTSLFKNTIKAAGEYLRLYYHIHRNDSFCFYESWALKW